MYNSEFASLQETVFRPARELVEDLIGEEARKARLSLDRRVRTEAALEELGREARKSTGDSSRAVRTEVDKVASEVRDAAGKSLKTVELELAESIERDPEDRSLRKCPMRRSSKRGMRWRGRILKTTEDQRALLSSVLDQLQAIDVTGESSTAEQLMAIEQRNILLEEEAEADAQLAQLGMAIEIINHEFSGTIRLCSEWIAQIEGLG